MIPERDCKHFLPAFGDQLSFFKEATIIHVSLGVFIGHTTPSTWLNDSTLGPIGVTVKVALEWTARLSAQTVRLYSDSSSAETSKVSPMNSITSPNTSCLRRRVSISPFRVTSPD